MKALFCFIVLTLYIRYAWIVLNYPPNILEFQIIVKMSKSYQWSDPILQNPVATNMNRETKSWGLTDLIGIVNIFQAWKKLDWAGPQDLLMEGDFHEKCPFLSNRRVDHKQTLNVSPGYLTLAQVT